MGIFFNKANPLWKHFQLFVSSLTTFFSWFSEFMSGGSIYDYLHKHKGTFKLPSLLKVAIDVSKGMNYLHQNNIIHRDLKAANLLMDENEVYTTAVTSFYNYSLMCIYYDNKCRLLV